MSQTNRFSYCWEIYEILTFYLPNQDLKHRLQCDREDSIHLKSKLNYPNICHGVGFWRFYWPKLVDAHVTIPYLLYLTGPIVVWPLYGNFLSDKSIKPLQLWHIVMKKTGNLLLTCSPINVVTLLLQKSFL